MTDPHYKHHSSILNPIHLPLPGARGRCLPPPPPTLTGVRGLPQYLTVLSKPNQVRGEDSTQDHLAAPSCGLCLILAHREETWVEVSKAIQLTVNIMRLGTLKECRQAAMNSSVKFHNTGSSDTAWQMPPCGQLATGAL